VMLRVHVDDWGQQIPSVFRPPRRRDEHRDMRAYPRYSTTPRGCSSTSQRAGALFPDLLRLDLGLAWRRSSFLLICFRAHCMSACFSMAEIRVVMCFVAWASETWPGVQDPASFRPRRWIGRPCRLCCCRCIAIPSRTI